VRSVVREAGRLQVSRQEAVRADLHAALADLVERGLVSGEERDRAVTARLGAARRPDRCCAHQDVRRSEQSYGGPGEKLCCAGVIGRCLQAALVAAEPVEDDGHVVCL